MKRKVNFPDQCFDIAVIAMSANAMANGPQKVNLLNQFPQIIADKTTSNLYDSKCTVTRLSNMADTQNVCV